jgi:hypothetical protein
MNMPEDQSIPPIVAEAPTAVVHTIEAVPPTAVTGAETAVELPHAAIHETLKGLTAATEALTLAANRIADTATHVPEAVVEPIAEATESIPDVVSPPPDRFVRRNGRKVKVKV